MKRLQCPSCGGPLQPSTGSSATCAYCGSSIRLERDAAGAMEPVLTRLDSGTNYLAKEALYRRGQEELEKVRENLATNTERLQTFRKARKRPGYLAVWALGGLGLYGLLQGAQDDVTFGLILLAVGFIIWLNAFSKRRRYDREEATYLKAIDSAETLIDERGDALEQLRADLDALATRL